MADINGDGLPDLIRLFEYTTPPQYGDTPVTSSQKQVYLNTGSAFVSSSSYTTSLPNAFFASTEGRDMGTRLVDINGDNLPDLVQMYYGIAGRMNAHLNTGTGFQYSSAYSTGLANSNMFFSGFGDRSDMGTRLADINGDGLVDLIQLYKPSNWDYGNNEQLKVAINTGSFFDLNNTYNNGRIPNTFFSGSTTDGAGTHDMGTRLADINGDGLLDLIQLYLPVDGSTPQRRTHLNTGKQFEEAISIFYVEDYYISDSARNSLGTEIFDVNGDGAEDIVQSYQPVAGGYYGGILQKRVLLSKKKSIKLSEVVDSLGGRQKVSYGLGTNRSLYLPASPSTYPLMSLGNPGFLVSTLQTDNGKGGFNSLSYSIRRFKSAFTRFRRFRF